MLGLAERVSRGYGNKRSVANLLDEARATGAPLGRRQDDRVDLLADHPADLTSNFIDGVDIGRSDHADVYVSRRWAGLALYRRAQEPNK